MHGSIRVPCWEPIRWKPWERSEPYVSLPACNRPSVGRGPYFSSHTLPKHTHTETHNRMYSMQRLYTNCHFPVSGATHFQVALLLSSCLDVWGFDKMSKASKNDFTTEKGSGQEKKVIRLSLLNSLGHFLLLKKCSYLYKTLFGPQQNLFNIQPLWAAPSHPFMCRHCCCWLALCEPRSLVTNTDDADETHLPHEADSVTLQICIHSQ